MLNKFPFKLLLACMLTMTSFTILAQNDDKSKRPSPLEKASNTTSDGVTITIEYSAPSVKGRTIWGTNIVEYDKVWRTGANEATTFEVNKDVTIEGKKLPAGKYSLFTIIPKDGGDVTVIFNKEASQWGAYKYKEAEDALRVKVKSSKGTDVQEKLKFDVNKTGKVDFAWEKMKFSFNVKAA